MKYNFDDFVKSNEINMWLVEPGLQIYARKNLVFPGLFDLANITANKRGQGAYTAFLARYEGFAFYVENVVFDRFADYHRKRGWAEIPCAYGVCPSFLNEEAVRRGLGLRPNVIFHAREIEPV